MSQPAEVVQELEGAMQQTIRTLSHTVAQASGPQSPLESTEIHEKRIQHEFSQYTIYAKKRCIDGFFSWYAGF